MKVDQELWHISRYNIYKEQLPQRTHPVIRVYAGYINEVFSQEESSITTLILLHRNLSRRRLISTDLYVFGRFRKPYRAIDQTAKLLAPIYAEMVILPIITPITSREWEKQRKAEGSLYSRVRRNGIISYSVEALVGS